MGLDKEPFVAGADVLLDRATAEIPDAVNGFRLTFSQHEFPEYDECIKWKRSEASGNVYWSDKFEMEGWGACGDGGLGSLLGPRSAFGA